jgi:hypothetical protein
MDVSFWLYFAKWLHLLDLFVLSAGEWEAWGKRSSISIGLFALRHCLLIRPWQQPTTLRDSSGA